MLSANSPCIVGWFVVRARRDSPPNVSNSSVRASSCREACSWACRIADLLVGAWGSKFKPATMPERLRRSSSDPLGTGVRKPLIETFCTLGTLVWGAPTRSERVPAIRKVHNPKNSQGVRGSSSAGDLPAKQAAHTSPRRVPPGGFLRGGRRTHPSLTCSAVPRRTTLRGAQHPPHSVSRMDDECLVRPW